MTTFDWVLFALLLGLLVALSRGRVLPGLEFVREIARAVDEEFDRRESEAAARQKSNVIPFPKSRTKKGRRQ